MKILFLEDDILLNEIILRTLGCPYLTQSVMIGNMQKTNTLCKHLWLQNFFISTIFGAHWTDLVVAIWEYVYNAEFVQCIFVWRTLWRSINADLRWNKAKTQTIVAPLAFASVWKKLYFFVKDAVFCWKT